MGTERSRIFKVEWLKDAISNFFNKDPNGVISKSKLLSNFAISCNSTERTGREILNTLENIKLIKLNGDNIINGK